MTKEFKLIEKVWETENWDASKQEMVTSEVIDVPDIKEFVKLIKEDISEAWKYDVKTIKERIDKRTGFEDG